MRKLEFGLFFIIIPIIYFMGTVKIHVLGYLWLSVLLACFLGRKNLKSWMKEDWSAKFKTSELKFVLLRFLILSTLLGIVVYITLPDRFLNFPLHNTKIWLLMIPIYPLISVIPQNFIYRTFLKGRYRGIFKHDLSFILMGAFVFGFMHLVFRNWVAIGLCLIGGYLFLSTYIKTKSFWLTTIEHSLYGIFIYSIGLDQYLTGATASILN